MTLETVAAIFRTAIAVEDAAMQHYDRLAEEAAEISRKALVDAFRMLSARAQERQETLRRIVKDAPAADADDNAAGPLPVGHFAASHNNESLYAMTPAGAVDLAIDDEIRKLDLFTDTIAHGDDPQAVALAERLAHDALDGLAQLRLLRRRLAREFPDSALRLAARELARCGRDRQKFAAACTALAAQLTVSLRARAALATAQGDTELAARIERSAQEAAQALTEAAPTDSGGDLSAADAATLQGEDPRIGAVADLTTPSGCARSLGEDPRIGAVADLEIAFEGLMGAAANRPQEDIMNRAQDAAAALMPLLASLKAA